MLTKSAYLAFLRCPQEYWLQHHSPNPDAELTLQEKHLREQGYEVQRNAAKMSIFNGGAAGPVSFQHLFQTEEFHAAADIVITDSETGKISIYEVKSSASVKPEHIDDVAFQKMAAEDQGFKVAKTYIITVDTTYTRNGHVDPDGLLKVHDVTEQAEAKLTETIAKSKEAVEYLKTDPVPDIADHCDDKLDCGFIRYHFKDIPVYNVTHISRLNRERCTQLLKQGIIDILHVPDDFVLTERQRRQVDLARLSEPIIAADDIRTELAQLKYPLNFLDYESFSYAVPHFHSIRPYQQMIFQYSLHTIPQPDCGPAHAYHLSKNDGNFPPREIAESLFSRLSGDPGTVIVWNAAFEKTRNKELGAMFPEFADFFAAVNDSIFDLETIFKKELYQHPKFLGKTSIKNVMPVLYPGGSYTDLNIPDGTTASIRWYHMATKRVDETECQKIFEDLCQYCHLDTLAMVEIFKVLRAL